MRNFLAAITLLVVGCATQGETGTSDDALKCATDIDCASAVGGGRCNATTHVCHADNECSSAADCPAATDVCVRASAFGGHGLCVQPGQAPEPTPVAACVSSTAICPPWEACASDGRCHAKFCVTDAQCPSHEVCVPDCPGPQAGAVVFGHCEPPGPPIHVCPGPSTTPPGQ